MKSKKQAGEVERGGQKVKSKGQESSFCPRQTVRGVCVSCAVRAFPMGMDAWMQGSTCKRQEAAARQQRGSSQEARGKAA